jgi:hypothetical protein
MIHRRGVLPALLLLVLVLAGFALQLSYTPNTSTPAPRATPTPSAGGRAVVRSLAAVERAYAAGDVRRLCRPGALLDPAAVGPGCERSLEQLMANVPRLHVSVRAASQSR